MGTKNEEEWFRKFYDGTFLVQGWKSRMKQILEGLPPGDREEMRGLLTALGEKIGREWARENKIRRIDTEMLQQWGQELMSAKRKGPRQLARQIHELAQEVKQLLA